MDLTGQIGSAKINLTAVTATTAGQGRFGAIVWVKSQDVQKAAKVLGAVKERRPKAAEVGAGAKPGCRRLAQ